MNTVIEREIVIVDVKNDVKVKDNKNEYFKEIALSRLGETRLNTLGSKMWIVNYTSATDTTVQFKDGYITTGVQYTQFCNGRVKNPNDASVFGHGCVGVGAHVSTIDGKMTPQYRTWTHMLERSYSAKYHLRKPTYIGITVCDEWLNFQVFAAWYDTNFYAVEDQEMAIDKDILSKGNKVYSPETCVFVPQSVNSLFTKRDAKRGKTPLGVSWYKSGKYQASCSTGKGKLQYLGLFTTPEEAFLSYKAFKENLIKQIAESYKTQIPDNLYRALINYTVEIDD